mgnify:FL=1
MLKNIDYNLFQIFVEVANVGNITKASENLFITQPAVTQALNRLEESLNCKLFIRQSKGVQLTDYGKLIYGDICESLNLINKAVGNVQKLSGKENAVLRIGCGANIAKWLINEPCKELLSKNSTLKIELYDMKVNELMEKLEKGEIDCFISYENILQYKNIANFKVKSTSYCFVGGSAFKKFSNGIYDVAILNNLPFVAPSGKPSNTGSYFKRLCEEFGLNLNVRIEAGRFGTILEFVRDNVGIAFIPEYIANEVCDNQRLFKINIDIPLKEVDFDVYYNKHYQSKILTDLLNKLKSAS